MLDSGILRDLLVQEDVGVVRDMVEEAELEEEEEEEARKKARKHVHDTFKKIYGDERYGKANEEYKSATADRRPFRPLEIGDAADAILEKLSPPMPVRTKRLANAGNFVITNRGVRVRSYSWTLIRTPKQALVLTLKRAWRESERKHMIKPSPAVWEAIEGLMERIIPGMPR